MDLASAVKNNEVVDGHSTRGWELVQALPGKLRTNVSEFPGKIKKLGQGDPRRIVHSFKVGLAITLVSLFYYFDPVYVGFGSSAIWAVLTVVVVFEFSVGKFNTPSLLWYVPSLSNLLTTIFVNWGN